ncbi:UDP-glucuronic acid decarboxylase family protein [Nonomuraea sp. NPDC050404]|uniref:UDP-glucuronic acid decarboxylase family protein n=1 Tax=Nonomuraea sp. NPDC050404 TaxID=3155783 RepID=UPI0033D01BC5
MRWPAVAITGGAGFLGSHLCERFLAEGYNIYCVDNFLTGAVANVEHLMANDHFRLIRADVSQHLVLPDVVDAVLHFASPASPTDYLRLPIDTLRVGSSGTFNALELAKEKGARFVLASTSETYGDPLVHPQPETYWGNVNPVGPRGVYDEAKRFAEAMTTAFRRACGVDTAILRIFNTFGPRMRPFDGRAIPTFIRQALLGEPITVSGDGLQTRSICYVDDLVEGIFRMLNSDLDGPINLGNPHEISMLALAQWIKELTGSESEIAFVPRPQDDPKIRRPDITLAQARLGWTPKIPIEDGLRHTIAWFQEHPRLWTAGNLARTSS